MGMQRASVYPKLGMLPVCHRNLRTRRRIYQ
jgi:hypothetical protein